ncbi:TPA: hypothetical protein ACF351_000489 [Clostridium perfringens]|nr:hypothetical protein [Clostridium perfringens]ELP5177543.1 hypothetical protein [Clostridium perfringens]MBO3400009.1 hypothetical protein [Clostridium perfringens]MDH5096693.1 hypothetical protein [Clostridium perfringens]MDK0900120.1 hypothetical protein [Clostridium perfringens]MDM1010748.1 hypothetical protein [Clostridium perfringens]
MATKIIIVEPELTEEENNFNWQRVLEALEPIAKEIFLEKTEVLNRA